jgi:hypothetical protein
MSYFGRTVEEKIRQAQQEGVFDNLPGSGKPLLLEDESAVPSDLRMAYKMLKNAHCLPPELELHREILNLRDLLRSVEDETERNPRIREINFLITKLNLLRKKPISLEVQQMYATKIAKDGGPTSSEACSAYAKS